MFLFFIYIYGLVFNDLFDINLSHKQKHYFLPSESIECICFSGRSSYSIRPCEFCCGMVETSANGASESSRTSRKFALESGEYSAVDSRWSRMNFTRCCYPRLECSYFNHLKLTLEDGRPLSYLTASLLVPGDMVDVSQEKELWFKPVACTLVLVHLFVSSLNYGCLRNFQSIVSAGKFRT